MEVTAFDSKSPRWNNRRMRAPTLICWLVCLALAASHLIFLAGYQVSLEMALFALVLLACYSVPFLVLTRVAIQQRPPAARIFSILPFVLTYAISLWIPGRRFLPGYRSDALESIAYLAFPFIELFAIAVLLGLRSVLFSRKTPEVDPRSN